MKPVVLATAAEICSIYDRATDAIDALLDGAEEEAEDIVDAESLRDSARRMEYLLDALRFCAVAAAQLRDPSLGDVVIGAVEQLAPYDDDATSARACAHRAVSAMLAAGCLGIDAARELAKSPHADLRQEIAESLPPRGEPERALLRDLAGDPVAAVRRAAKEKLRALADVPWWHGKWRTDPAAGLLPGEAEGAGPALARASAILDQPLHRLFGRDGGLVPELLAELAKLPPPLAVEAIELFCASAETYYLGQAAPLLSRMLALPGGLDAFERMLAGWSRADRMHYLKARLIELVKGQPDELRRAACDRLLAVAAAAPWAERCLPGGTAAWLAASIVAEAWLPSADVTPLLDALLAFERDAPPRDQRSSPREMDHVSAELAGALRLEGVDPAPVLDRLCEARIAGYPGEWNGIGHRADALLARAPREALRRTAQRALDASEDTDTLRWAAVYLLGRGFDPALDGPPEDRVAAFFSSPRLRAALFSDGDLVDRALPHLREQLRRDALTFDEAAAVVASIGRLHGGVADTIGHPSVPLPPLEGRRRAAREAVGPFLGPPDLQIPVTPAEWDALDRARRAADQVPPRGDVMRWTQLLREGPWTPAERAEFDVYYEEFLGGEAGLAYPLAIALLAKPEAELVPRMDELFSRTEPSARRLLRGYRDALYEALGREPPPDPGAAAKPEEAAEGSAAWGDEDDESDSADEGDDEDGES
jgi:hypothetical protein